MWDLMRRGVVATDPLVRATQQRLQACAYTMAHPETGELVPACVQHSVLDLDANQQLRLSFRSQPRDGSPSWPCGELRRQHRA